MNNAPVRCPGFLISQGSAEALDSSGGKTKHRLIFHFLSNTSAKNYRNRIVYVKIIASRRCMGRFWDTVYIVKVVVISQKWCKSKTLLLQTINRKWYMHGPSNRSISDDIEWPSKSFAYCKSMSFFVQLRSSWQNFNWYCASRGASATAEFLVEIICQFLRTLMPTNFDITFTRLCKSSF